jgi:hypothetical protein
MVEKYLNIVSFNVPCPADYGGVIDVFYRLRSLAENGVKIVLHAFEYGRNPAPELEKYCWKVYYYRRKTGLGSQLSALPYVVYSRRSEELLSRLQENDYPVLFEGLHSCYYLGHPLLRDRLKLVRAHNVEHWYYRGLARNSSSILKKLYFNWEAFRLKIYERQLHQAQYIFTLSTVEKAWFEERYGAAKVCHLPVFFDSEGGISLSEAKPYVLYHGDLSIPENVQAARFLISRVASLDSGITWVFAGRNPDASLLKCAALQPNVLIRANVPSDELMQLIREAAVNILYTNQLSGVKLKLLNVLYRGRWCLANRTMVAGSGLEDLCRVVSDSPEAMLAEVRQCLHTEFPAAEALQREARFNQLYNNTLNARMIVDCLAKYYRFTL